MHACTTAYIIKQQFLIIVTDNIDNCFDVLNVGVNLIEIIPSLPSGMLI